MRLPNRLASDDVSGLIGSVAPILEATKNGEALRLDFTGHAFCDPAGAVIFGAAGARFYRQRGARPELDGWATDSYLARFGLKKLLGYREPFWAKRPRPDDFIGLTEVAEYRDRARVCEGVRQILHIDHDGAANLLSYALEEVLRNVDDHADSPTNALLHAQRYSRTDEVVLAIADTGRGILASLRERYHDLSSDAEAVAEALKAGVSCRNTRKGVNQGVGLTATAQMIRGVGGTFQLLSGRALLTTTEEGTIVSEVTSGEWPGVVVILRVCGRDDIDWAQVHAHALQEVRKL